MECKDKIERQKFRELKSKERYAQQQKSKRFRAYSVYHQQNGPNKNSKHSLLDGKIFKTDDPYLYVIYPPNCSGCNCKMSTLSERQLKNNGGEVLDVKEHLLTLMKQGKLSKDDVKEMESFDPRV